MGLMGWYYNAFNQRQRFIISVVIGMLAILAIMYAVFVNINRAPPLIETAKKGERGEIRNPPLFSSFSNVLESHFFRYKYKQNFIKYSPNSAHYDISIVADMDHDSRKDKNKMSWISLLKNGRLTRDPETRSYYVEWSEPVELQSKLNEGGRGMELSELTYFNKKLYSFDDRTGVVFSVGNEQAIPEFILMEGNGQTTKGQKTEWATVKDNEMYVGSTGKEWTTPTGEFVHNNPLWINIINENGEVRHEDWTNVYTMLREATGTTAPGYMIHEAIRFNADLRRWYFFPRRISSEKYDDTKDEERGSNIIISTDEHFQDLKISTLGKIIPTHGFSSFQFVPWHPTEVVVLKSEEFKGTITTYIAVYDLDGTVLMEETSIPGGVKFEGIEFV
eukprot:CAMPEP_0174262198 /NCGR_PEP_ID=MMETSP0439-20130205/12835_1 /TAXON_ID=0 /ORGANISM="Stereomyxa ramosa, Strain Chinc5" /LENGTH=389 /DNA_ID=CAMNT_0015346865 /DNA_START=89 /DNA_END=1258 /DNA_ORIENTATION=+